MKLPYHTKEITITSHLVYNNKFFQLHYVGHISVISLVGGLLVQAEWHSVVVASPVCHGATPVDGVPDAQVFAATVTLHRVLDFAVGTAHCGKIAG